MPKITPRKLLFILLLALFLVTLSMPIQPSVSAHAAKADVEYWAVIVGVADYPGSLNDLYYTDDDAYDVRDALLASTNWEASHITMLIDSYATKSNIQNAVNWMATSGDSNDVFFFFFSGHGTRLFDDQIPIDEADGRDEALCQYDHNSVGAILDDELGIWLSALPGAPVLVAIDTCYSGGMIKTANGQSRGLLGAGLPATGDGFAKDLDDAIAGVVLTACDDDEESWEIGVLQNGLFTYYFVEGLAGAADDQGNSDGSVSMEEAFDYLYPLVVAYDLSPYPNQHPQEYDNWPGEAVLTILIPPTSTPTVTTLDYTSLGASEGQPTATLYGTITHDGGEACEYQFQYGTSPSAYIDETGWTGSINTGESFSETISNLEQETTYYFRAQARNTAGTSSGDELSFTTPKLFSVTLGTSPDAVSLIVDGTTYPPADLPKSFSWANGSAHDCMAPSPAVSSEEGTQYVFTSWSPDGDTSPSKTITVSGNATYTANYKTQHYLAVDSEYGDDPSGEGWYDEGNTTSIGTAEETIIDDDNAGTRYVFLNWIVDGDDETDNSISITMDAPHTAVTDYKTQHYLTVESDYGDPEGEDWYDEGTSAEIQTYDIITDDNTRYVFLNWVVDGDDDTDNPASVTIDAPYTAVTDYKTQHYLTVNSEYGDPSGEGWHDEGDTATASVTSPVGTIVRKVFTKWSGGSTATSSSTTILMDEPKTVTANWQDDYLYLYIIIVGIVVVVGGGSALVVSTTRGRKPRRYGGTF